MSHNHVGIPSQTKNNAATPMPLDILAIQNIYGANMSFHAGDDIYRFTADANTPIRPFGTQAASIELMRPATSMVQ